MVLGINTNEDARSGKLAKQLSSLGLRDLILWTDASSSSSATLNWNKNQTPVDAIWGTRVINVIRAGYGPFNALNPSAWSDGHRSLWVEICNRSSRSKHPQTQVAPIHTDCVCAADPRSRNMYNCQVNKAYIKIGIFKTKPILAAKAKLFANGSSSLSHNDFLSTFYPKFIAFHFKTRQIRGKVADKMRKIYAGGQDFSPQAQVFRDTIEFWE